MKEVSSVISADYSALKNLSTALGKCFQMHLKVVDNKLPIPESLGGGEFVFYELEEGLGLLKTHLYFSTDVRFTRIGDDSNDYFLIHYNLSPRKTRFDRINNIYREDGETWLSSVRYVSSSGNKTGILFKENQWATILTVVIHRSWIMQDIIYYPKRIKEKLQKKIFTDTPIDGIHKLDLESIKIVRELLVMDITNEWSKMIMLGSVFKLISVFIKKSLRGDVKNLDFKEVIRVIGLKEELEKNMNVPWPKIEMAAEICMMSRSKFLRIFKGIYDKTYYDLYREIRMQKAAELLLNGLSVSETAENVGFVNKSHFAKEFKGFFLVDPSNYKL